MTHLNFRRAVRLAAASMLLTGGFTMIGCGGSSDKTAKTPADTTPAAPPPAAQPPAAAATTGANDTLTTPSGLRYVFLKHGTGAQAMPGQTVSVHYIGTLTSGKKFDSSRDRGQPFEFKLGAGQVIRGWDEGIALLHVGDRAVFFIPGDLGYGARGAPPDIPPNATLVFDVELLGVR